MWRTFEILRCTRHRVILRTHKGTVRYINANDVYLVLLLNRVWRALPWLYSSLRAATARLIATPSPDSPVRCPKRVRVEIVNTEGTASCGRGDKELPGLAARVPTRKRKGSSEATRRPPSAKTIVRICGVDKETQSNQAGS